MSKAEDRALEAYPKDIEEYVDVNGVKSVVDNNSWQRTIFLKGYHQAEKDLKLGWKDIKLIIDIVDSENLKPHLFDEIDYQEVLKRFKNQRNEDKH